MSMRVDRRDVFPGVTLQPRTPSTWIPDERVQRCFSCNASFSFLKRKHHCRACGRVFCYTCTAYRESLPSYFKSYAPSPVELMTGTQRMCAQCASSLRKTTNCEWLVRALSVMPLTFPQLFRVRLLNKTWNHAVNTLLSLYRGLQYKLPCEKYSNIEIQFLVTHFSEFGHHIPWQVHVYCALMQKNKLKTFHGHMEMHHRLSCRWCLCSRTCSTRLSIGNIIRLGMAGCLKHDSLIHSVVGAWKDIHVHVHEKMMFWWVYLSCKRVALFRDGLLPMCRKDIRLTYALWFECELQKDPLTHNILTRVQNKLLRPLDQNTRDDLHASIALVELLRTLVDKRGKRTHLQLSNVFFSEHSSVRLPWKPSVFINGITSVKRYRSASKPLAVVCHTNDRQSLKILIKKEDVRTDRLAMVIGYWICVATKHVHIRTYDVFPFSKDMGCLVMLPGATTLYDVRKTSTLLNFIMTKNPTRTVSYLRERVVQSCVGACLLAFTIGLGDRHLENILVAADGSLAHVDFGYVLGDDPKHISTPMRITDDMIDAMGGRESATFVSFIQMTQKGYETMRLYAPFWYQLLAAESYIHGREDRPIKRIRDHVLDRFVPGEWDEEASLHIQTVVQRAAEDSYFQQAADMLHQASNQMTQLFQIEL